MANTDDESRLEEEDGGGEVKSFLDHLEDLRWMLIKSGAATAIGMVVCLAAGNTVVNILKRPLERADLNPPPKENSVVLRLGTNELGTFQLATNHAAAPLLSPKGPSILNLVPVQIDGNWMLSVQPETNSATTLPVPKSKFELTQFGPIDGFYVALQVAIWGGLALASPFILYYLGQFILPALKLKEKRYLFRGLGFGTLLFFTGVVFCYQVLMPLALAASVKYSQWLGFSVYQWRAEEYISFVTKFMFGMGIGFEMPVVILVLVKIGLLDYAKLSSFRRYMIVINLILGAVLTTPEVITQVMMAIPLQLLYEISIWITWWWERRDRKRAAEANLAES